MIRLCRNSSQASRKLDENELCKNKREKLANALKAIFNFIKRLSQVHLGRNRLRFGRLTQRSNSPIRSGLKVYPPQLQLNYHITPGEACNASYAREELCTFSGPLEFILSCFHCFHSLTLISYTHGGARCYHWRFPRLRKCRLGIEKLKVARGDRLDYQHTLMDLILSILASGGEPSPSTMAIVVEDGITEFKPYFSHKITIEHTVSLRKFDLRSSTDPLYELDPELELILRRLRKARKIVVNNSSSFDFLINSNQLPIDISLSIFSHFAEPGQMENNDRTLKEFATLDVMYQPWCIQYPQLEPAQTYELKSGLINLLPKFHGLAGEDPYKHLKEFHVVCSTMRPQGIPKDYIKMKAFPFSLDGAAKDWLYL
ncbi:hypothetical protein CR513_33966, partial [Mucuna pruriens]